MAGFSGRVLLEGNFEEANRLVRDCIELANTLQAWKEMQGLPSVTRTFNLSGGAYVVVGLLQHQQAMRITVPVAHTFNLPDLFVDPKSIDTTGVMDVISGKVTNGRIDLEEATFPDPDNPGQDLTQEYELLQGFIPTTPTASRYTGEERRLRLAVKEPDIFKPPGPPGVVIYSQYSRVASSCYSGAMRRLVQLLFGVGTPTLPIWEQRWMEQEEKAPLSSEVILDDSLGGDDELVASAFGLYDDQSPSIALAYDYRFSKTHGVSFDIEDKPWLIEISSSGVFATKLGMDPVSLSVEGRARYLDVSPELSSFFDEFGGFPTFNSFPVGEDRTLYEKAGEVVELLSSTDMGDFYGKSAFSSEVGWSFDDAGKEAHNCCTGSEGGLGTGEHYAIKLGLEGETLPELGGSRAELAALIPNAKPWEVNKCRRMSEISAKSIVETFANDTEAGLQQFHDLQVTPTLVFNCSLIQKSKGILFHPSSPAGQPQIKFYEPMYDPPGLITWDFSPHDIGAYTETSDGPMFVTHVGNDLDIVRYASDFRPRSIPEAEDSRQPCQFTGGWAYTTYGGTPYLAGSFYSNRWDFREEITPDTVVTNYNGTPIGVRGSFGPSVFFGTCFYANSSSHFGVDWSTNGTTGRSLTVSVAIPAHTREAYYMTKIDTTNSASASNGFFTESTAGPQQQFWKLFNYAFHWNGTGCPSTSTLPGGINAGSVGCVAKKFNEWDVPSCVSDPIPGDIQYSVCPANSFEPGPLTISAPLWGDVIAGGVVSFGDFVDISPWTNHSIVDQTKHSWQVNLMTDTVGGIITKEGTHIGVPLYDVLSNWWTQQSPQGPLDVAFIALTSSSLGGNVTNYLDDMNHSTWQVKHEGSPLEMHGIEDGLAYTAYTGVIE